MAMLDIRAGDILVVDGAEYPIKYAAAWASIPSTVTAFGRVATARADTKRSPGMVDGKRGEPETFLTDLKCTPLDPLDPQTQRRLALETPHTVLQTFVGDAYGFIHLAVEDLRR